MKNLLMLFLLCIPCLLPAQTKYTLTQTKTNTTQIKYSAFSEHNKEKIYYWDPAKYDYNLNALNDGISQGRQLVDCYELKSNSLNNPSTIYIDEAIDRKRDFEYEASVKFVHGLGDNLNGLGWGINNDKSGFYFGFSSGGYFCVFRQSANSIKYHKDWTYSSLINVDGYNLLTVRKIKNIYYYFINKSLVLSSPYEDFFGDRFSLNSNRNSEININKVSISYLNKGQTNSEGFSLNLPPILSIQDIVLSKSTIKANENAELSITMKNIGGGDANNVYVNLSSDIEGLSFPIKNVFPSIVKNGGVQTIHINILGLMNLPSSEANLKLEIVEPNFKVKIQGKQIKFRTQEYLKPSLLLAKFAVLENLSANPNNQIDVNEQIDLKFAVQNIGQGNAEKVNISVMNNQRGVLLLGVDSNNQTIRKNPSINTINSGKYESITYRYFVNSEFSGGPLLFTISASEKFGKYGFSEIKSVDINKTLSEEGYIRNVSSLSMEVSKNEKVIIEDIPDFVSDVDVNIPINSINNNKTFAIVIGNENYSNEIEVNYALNDARIFKQYLIKTLGIPENNIEYLENATYGQILDKLTWIKEITKTFNTNAKVIFYYAGHGMPDEETKSAYILPSDGNSKNPSSAIRLNQIFNSLTEYQCSSVSVFLDACFSGASRESNELMLAQSRGVKIKPRSEVLNGNIVVFSASNGDQTAYPFDNKKHGMFTYFLLKKLQESKGDINLAQLSNFVITNVSQTSLVINKKSQVPQINVSDFIKDKWRDFRLK